jgi:hypothetical protein
VVFVLLCGTVLCDQLRKRARARVCVCVCPELSCSELNLAAALFCHGRLLLYFVPSRAFVQLVRWRSGALNIMQTNGVEQ